MMFYVVTIIMLLIDVSFPADIQLTLQDAVNDNSAKGLKSLAIKGIAKYKPGGSAMILSLLIQGPPGIMPGAPAGPTSAPAPGGPTPGPGGATTGPGGAGKSTSAATPNPTPTPSGGAGGASPSPTSGSTSGGGGGGGEFKDFEKAALDEHNKFRKIHGSQPMKLNRQMCDEAAEYAKIIAKNNNMKHSTKEQRKGQGENLAMGCSSNKGGLTTTTQAVVNWYNEVCDPGYEFSVGRGQSGTGHFTQVVWNDSVELGIGKADSEEGRMKCTYVVGRYKPLGNFYTYNEDYKKNVKKGSFDRQAYCSSIKTKGGFKKNESFLDKVLRRKK